MDNPKVSIITATFNSESTLEDCIKSIIDQGYKNIEYIIIDGGSKDRTVDIINKYNGNITHWISEPDKGVYDAWNKGLKLSSGEWILFVGSDDVLYPDAIASYIDYISAQSEILDMVSSRIHITNKDNEVIRTFGWPWKWSVSKRVFTIAHPGAFHNKRLFEVYGDYNTSYRICGDYELLLRAGVSLKTAFMDKITLRMQIGGLSDSYKVYLEHFNVVVNTGKLSRITASYDFVKEYSKFLIKRVFRLFGINLALKK